MNKATLGSICYILNGYAFKSDKYTKNGVRIIRITNVQKGYVEDKNPQFYPVEECQTLKKFYLYENDLLLSLTGNVGRVAILTKDFLPAALNQRVACVRIKSENHVNIRYLFQYLNSDLFESACIESAQGIAQKNMSTEWVKEFEIPLPPLAEQQKISAELDKISELIAKRKSQIEKLDLLVKAKFVEMFGENAFAQKTLAEVTVKITDGTHQSPRFLEKGIPFLFVSNIVKNNIVYSTNKFISEEEYEILIKRTPIEIGDILLTTVGSYGNPAVVEKNQKFCFQRHIGYIKPKQDIVNSYFLKHFLLSPNGKEQIEFRAKGIAQKTLNLSEIKTIKLPIPPLPLQTQFADFVQKTEQTKTAMQKSLTELETLYKARMQEYFE